MLIWSSNILILGEVLGCEVLECYLNWLGSKGLGLALGLRPGLGFKLGLGVGLGLSLGLGMALGLRLGLRLGLGLGVGLGLRLGLGLGTRLGLGLGRWPGTRRGRGIYERNFYAIITGYIENPKPIFRDITHNIADANNKISYESDIFKWKTWNIYMVFFCSVSDSMTILLSNWSNMFWKL